MKNLASTWGLYQQAKEWSCRPSSILAIENDYLAYCLDQAVNAWGSHVMSELDKIEGKSEKDTRNKRHRKLLQLLNAPAQQRFKSLRKPTK